MNSENAAAPPLPLTDASLVAPAPIALILVFAGVWPFLPGLHSEAPVVLLYWGCFFPVLAALWHGQDSILLLLIFAAFFRALRRDKSISAGRILALGAFKPQFIIPVLLVLLIARNWKFFAGFIQTSLALFLLCLPALGLRLQIAYPATLLRFSRSLADALAWHPESMANLRGVLYRALTSSISASELNILTFCLSFVTIALAVFVYLRTHVPLDLRIALLVAVTTLVSYHAYIHDFSLLLLPILVLSNRAAEIVTKRKILLVVPVLLALVVPFFLPNPFAIFAAFLAVIVTIFYESLQSEAGCVARV